MKLPKHTPLTYEAACALEKGDKVICLDTGIFSDEPFNLHVGDVYETVEYFADGGGWKINTSPERFSLCQEDCHLFAKYEEA